MKKLDRRTNAAPLHQIQRTLPSNASYPEESHNLQRATAPQRSGRLLAASQDAQVCNTETQFLSRYLNLSDFDLKKAMLAALGELSNLRADSKSLRRRLESTRSAIAELHNRMSLIKQAWDGSDPSRLVEACGNELFIEEDQDRAQTSLQKK